MKIANVKNIPAFRAETTETKAESKNKQEKKYVDPLATWPQRGLGYTNDIGVAINEIAPTTAKLFWVPALMYFGADVYDKYKNKGNKYDPNAQRAFFFFFFQAFASILLPAVFGHIGQSGFSFIDKFRGEKLSTNAKEQTLRFLKNYSSEHDIFNANNRDTVIKDFEESFNIFYQDKVNHYKKQNIFSKTYDTTLANCKKGAIANSKEQRIKDFAKKQFLELLNNCSDSEALKQSVDKKVFKLKVWKSAGSFTALLLTVKLIDDFVEKIIIKKVVEPQLSKIPLNSKKSISDFGNTKSVQSKQ